MNGPNKKVLWRSSIIIAMAVVGVWSVLNWPVPTLFVAPGVLWLARRRIPASLISPVWIVVLFLTGVGLVGYLVYGRNANDLQLLFNIDDHLARQTVLITAATTTLMVCGACLATLWGKKPEEIPTTKLNFESRWTTIAAIFMAILPLVVALLSLHSLWSRAIYMDQTAGSLTGALSMIALAGVLALGYLMRASSPRWRSLIGLVIAIEVVILFALASRQFAMAPVAIAFGAYIYKPDDFGRNILIGSAVLSVLLLPIPLYLRELQTEHGLAHYVPQLGSIPYGIDAIKRSFGNLALGFPVSGLSAFDSPKIGMDKIWISVNPLPGQVAGWYDITNEMRLAPVFPYSAIGEAWNVGFKLAVPLFLLIGVVFGHLDRRVREFMARGHQIVALTICGLAVLSGLLISSYNLRNSVRPLYYAIAIDVGVSLVLWHRSGTGIGYILHARNRKAESNYLGNPDDKTQSGDDGKVQSEA